MKREDPNFVPPNTVHAGALSEFNSKFASGVSLSEKRPRDDDGPAGREAKREKQQESDEEMELEDDDDDAPPVSKGEFAHPPRVFSPILDSCRRNSPNNTTSLCPATLYKLAPGSDRRCSFRPVSTVRSLLASTVPEPTVPWIRYRGLQSVRVVVSPTPNAAGQQVKMAQILYETPQLATVAKENLDGFALKKGWVMSVSYV